VGIGEVLREMSKLVNRIAFGADRAVRASRGKPELVRIGLDDDERFQWGEIEERVKSPREEWDRIDAIDERILASRAEKPIDVDRVLETGRGERDSRFEWMFGRG
jgi:hypothetical protein